SPRDGAQRSTRDSPRCTGGRAGGTSAREGYAHARALARRRVTPQKTALGAPDPRPVRVSSEPAERAREPPPERERRRARHEDRRETTRREPDRQRERRPARD